MLVPAAVLTLTCRVVRVAVRPTWKVAVIAVGLTTATFETATSLPDTLTVAGEVKFVPVSVTVTVAPRRAALGASEDSVGLGAGAALTVKDWAALVPPLVVTVTLWEPVAAVGAMTKVAVMRAELTTVTLATDTPAPPMAMVAPGLKLDPVSVTGTLAP